MFRNLIRSFAAARYLEMASTDRNPEKKLSARECKDACLMWSVFPR